MKLSKEDANQEAQADPENPYSADTQLKVGKNEDIDFNGGQVQDDRPEKLLNELSEFLVFHLLMIMFCFYLGRRD